MAFTVFKREDPDKLDAIETESGLDRQRGARYRASESLENAINVAISLGRPLLVSGEPGCGKTELGYCIARKLGISRLHFYAVKSDAEARSLFYEYDTLGRFHAAQIARSLAPETEGSSKSTDARQFIEYRALGRAILDAHRPDDIRHLIAGRYIHPGAPKESVVVIDEIDKAPRDFPNDLLNEIDQFWFRVPELGFSTKDRAPETPKNISAGARPIVVVTSNTERQLPDAFLRRCVYHHIAFPDWDTLRRIVDGHVSLLGRHLMNTHTTEGAAREELGRAYWVMEQARQSSLEKLPGTAELIDFVQVLRERRAERPDEPWTERFRACVFALAKTSHDAKIIESLVQSAPPAASKG